jgi:hypothetical protein
MKNKINTQKGFIGVVVIAIIAVLAIGGGVYVSQKNQEKKQEQMQLEINGDLENELNTNINANTNLDVNAGINGKVDVGLSGTVSLNSLLKIGKDSVCTVESTKGGANSKGTVYISGDGNMRGDFTSETSASGSVDSHMIVGEDMTYVWSGSQGSKMSTAMMNSNADSNASVESKGNVDLDSEVTYKCEDWKTDSSKFVAPSSVKFMDIDALIKGSAGLKIPGMN